MPASLSLAQEHIKVISWYLSLVCHEQQDLKQNSVYAKKLGELFKDEAMTNKISQLLLPTLKELNIPLKELANELGETEPEQEPKYEQPRSSFFSPKSEREENETSQSILKTIFDAIIKFFQEIADVMLSCFYNTNTASPN